eukprot:518119-Pyramimonas_sp.AAC.1
MQQKFEQKLGEVADSRTALTDGLFKQIPSNEFRPIEQGILAMRKHGVSRQDLRGAVDPLKAAVDGVASR